MYRMGMSLKLEITLIMCSTALNQGLRLWEKVTFFMLPCSLFI